jgi:hypothetical protein
MRWLALLFREYPMQEVLELPHMGDYQRLGGEQ